MISTQMGHITLLTSNVVFSLKDDDWWEVYHVALYINLLVLKTGLPTGSGTCFSGLFLVWWAESDQVQLSMDKYYKGSSG